MSQPIRRENGDVMETKTRLDDIIRGIKALDTNFPHSLASSRGGNNLNGKATSHGVRRPARYRIFAPPAP